MPSAASPTRATWSLASRPASPRRSAALRSAASRITRTCSEVPADMDARAGAALRASKRSSSSATRRRWSSTAAWS